MFTNFSKHSLKRLSQRASLKLETLINILERKVYLNIGSVPGFNTAYLLIYSFEDDEHFIVIQDLLNGTVLTFLRLQFKISTTRKITEKDLQKVKELTLKDQSRKLKEKPQDQTKKLPTNFYVTIMYLDIDGKQKAKEIMKLKVSDGIYGTSINELLKTNYFEDQFYINLFHEANLRGIKKENIWSVVIRQKAKQKFSGEEQPLIIDLKDKDFDENFYLTQ